MRVENNKQLPFIVSTEVKCYLSNAVFGGILLAYPNMEAWMYEHYIQLYYLNNKSVRNSKNKETRLDYYGGWSEPRELFKCQSYTRKELEKQNIISFIKDKIDDNKYCYTYINEFYLGNNHHNSHDIIVYGYDNEKSYIKVAGYFENDFKEKNIDYELFSKAYYSGIKISKRYDSIGGNAYFNTFQPNFNESTKYKINITKILNRCEEYLHSVNTGKRNSSDDPNHKMYELEGSTYGISIFNCLLTEIKENSKNKQILDYRKFHLIFEHKLMMKKRILYLSNEFSLISNNLLIEKIDELIKISNKLRLIVIKYNINNESKLLDRIYNYLNEIYNKDIQVINSLIEIIHDLI